MKTPALRRKATRPVERLIPARFDYLFSHRPVLWFEDGEAYDQLLSDMVADLKPETLIEYQLIKDMADTMWEIIRLRRLKTAAFEAEMPSAAGTYLGKTFRKMELGLGQPSTEETLQLLARSAAKGHPTAQKNLKAVLAAADMSYDELLYKTYALGFSTMNAIDAKLGRAERRYHDMITKFEQRRRILLAMNNSQSLNGSRGHVIDVPSKDAEPEHRSQE